MKMGVNEFSANHQLCLQPHLPTQAGEGIPVPGGRLEGGHLPLRERGHPSQEGVAVGFGQALLQDLGPLLHLAQLLAVALDFLLDVRQRARRVGLQLFQHRLLPLAQQPVQPLERLPDGGPQAFGGRLWGQSSGVRPEGADGVTPVREEEAESLALVRSKGGGRVRGKAWRQGAGLA